MQRCRKGARSTCTSGGSAPRAAIRIPARSSRRPSVGAGPARATGAAPAPGPAAAAVVTRLGAFDVGVAALELGAGRRTKADPVDHAVGILCFAKRGDTVLEGDDLAEVHARDDDAAEGAAAAVLAAYEIGDHAPPDHGIVLDVVA